MWVKWSRTAARSVAALRTQVSTYQTKLEEAEQRASHDTLTGLDNRQGVECKIQRRIAARQPFCVVMLDLNGFKQVNDTHGHEAGDDLLKAIFDGAALGVARHGRGGPLGRR